MRNNCPTCDNPGAIRVAPDTHQKLTILSRESQYDLACNVNETDARRRNIHSIEEEEAAQIVAQY